MFGIIRLGYIDQLFLKQISWESYKKRNDSIIVDLFQGITALVFSWPIPISQLASSLFFLRPAEKSDRVSDLL